MAADTLPLAAVQVGPPPELRDRIMAIVHPRPSCSTRPGREPTSRRHAGREGSAPAALVALLRPLPAAIAASALVAAGVIGGVVLTGGDNAQTVTGTVRIASAPTARASLLLSDDATKLQVRRMPRRRAARSTRCGSSARTRTPRRRRRSSGPTRTAAPTSRFSAGG
jgi:hypothetical protein